MLLLGYYSYYSGPAQTGTYGVQGPHHGAKGGDPLLVKGLKYNVSVKEGSHQKIRAT